MQATCAHTQAFTRVQVHVLTCVFRKRNTRRNIAMCDSTSQLMSRKHGLHTNPKARSCPKLCLASSSDVSASMFMIRDAGSLILAHNTCKHIS